MPIPTALAGCHGEPMVHRIDERWTMAFAAALGDTLDDYFDTGRPGGVVAHPLFAVCPEWPVIVASRAQSERLGVTEAELRTSVHASHDVVIHRLVRPGDVLATSLQTVGVVDITPGALTTTRLETVDADGLPVATTTQDAISLGVRTTGGDVPDPSPPAAIEGTDRAGAPLEVSVPVAAGMAHTYTECARIWNPIHTDRMVARSAGLPDIILHGTANLGLGVSAVIRARADDRPERVRRISCRFAAMVRLPSTVVARVWPANAIDDGRSTVPFEVVNADGEPAVADGLVVLERGGRDGA